MKSRNNDKSGDELCFSNMESIEICLYDPNTIKY